MRKTRILLGAVLLAVFAGWLLLAVNARRDEWPKVSVTLLGYTNDATGARLATFAVTNLSKSAVIRQAGYWMQSPGANPQNGSIVSWNLFTSGKTQLLPRETEMLSVVAPTNLAAWRISLSVSYPESIAKRIVRETLDWANIPKYSFGFRSDWINQ